MVYDTQSYWVFGLFPSSGVLVSNCLKNVLPKSSVLCFLWAKGFNAKCVHEEMFLVYDGKCLLHKAVHNWVEKFSGGRSKVADDARPGADVTETHC
jgi:hypothetical protein